MNVKDQVVIQQKIQTVRRAKLAMSNRPEMKMSLQQMTALIHGIKIRWSSQEHHKGITLHQPQQT